MKTPDPGPRPGPEVRATRMVTIGQLATLAGVTIRAVRHYHALGLLPEPRRDASGYRRYDADAATQLVRVRTLAEAGVPLTRVKELLAADPAEFSRAAAEIDRTLRSEIRQLKENRRRIAELAAGDYIALPPVVSGYLARLRTLGIHSRLISLEHDAWIMVAAHGEKRIPQWISSKTTALEDSDFLDCYHALGDSVAWRSNDGRLPKLADRLDAYVTVRTSRELLVGVLNPVTSESSPGWRRLAVQLAQRGWPITIGSGRPRTAPA